MIEVGALEVGCWAIETDGRGVVVNGQMLQISVPNFPSSRPSINLPLDLPPYLST